MVGPVQVAFGMVCLNIDQIGLHGCYTPQAAFDAVWGLLFGLAVIAIKGAVVKYAIDGIYHGIKDWFRRHPIHHAHFLHGLQRHPAATVAECKEGKCEAIEF